jgi:hypothetical protein
VERLNANAERDQIRQANTRLRGILLRAREALAGRQNFTIQEIRDLSEPLAEMRAIVSRSADLRASDKELDIELKSYAATLKELQTSLERVRFMLHAQRDHLAAAHEHIDRVSRWAETLKHTQ